MAMKMRTGTLEERFSTSEWEDWGGDVLRRGIFIFRIKTKLSLEN